MPHAFLEAHTTYLEACTKTTRFHHGYMPASMHLAACCLLFMHTKLWVREPWWLDLPSAGTWALADVLKAVLLPDEG